MEKKETNSGTIPNRKILHSDCLYLLERLPNQWAKLIYLDPPWHTANNLHPHSDSPRANANSMVYIDWLGSLVQQSHRVVTPDGNIAIHVEPQIEGYLRLITTELLPDTEVARISLAFPRLYARQGLPVDNHESLFLIRKSQDSVWNIPTRTMTNNEINERYNKKDSNGRQYTLTDLTVPAPSSCSAEWNGFRPPSGRRWRFSLEKLEQLQRDGRIFIDSRSAIPRLKIYADEKAEIPIGMDWSDIPAFVPARERTGVPGQQPLALLERLVKTTTGMGDIVVDPMCGAGTALLASEMLGRHWIGADTDAEAVRLANARIQKIASFPLSTTFDLTNMPIIRDTSSLPRSSICSGQPLRFVLNRPIPLEETRHYEFKEVKGGSPVRTIKNTADEYAVAFLNSEGGRILWGVRNEDRSAVGVHLNYRERDEVAKSVDNKMCAIQPSLPPSSWQLDFFPVYDQDSTIEDLWVVQLVVPRPSGDKVLYGTGSGEVFVKTSSGKKRLSFAEMQAEVIKRNSQNS